MKVEVTTTFLDGRDRFEKGDIRTVSDEDGARFVANGWAVEFGGQPAEQSAQPTAELVINSTTHKAASTIKG